MLFLVGQKMCSCEGKFFFSKLFFLVFVEYILIFVKASIMCVSIYIYIYIYTPLSTRSQVCVQRPFYFLSKG